MRLSFYLTRVDFSDTYVWREAEPLQHVYPSKHETFPQSWYKDGPPSTALAQNHTSAGWIYCLFVQWFCCNRYTLCTGSSNRRYTMAWPPKNATKVFSIYMVFGSVAYPKKIFQCMTTGKELICINPRWPPLHLWTTMFIYDFLTNRARNKYNLCFWCVFNRIIGNIYR